MSEPSGSISACGGGEAPLAGAAPRAAASRRLAAWAALALLLPFAACAPQPRPPQLVSPVVPQAAPGTAVTLPPDTPRARVGLLVPLTGSSRALGEAMLNAAQLALFDQADARVELLPRDTGGSPGGAMEATRLALSEGAKALAGPLTLTETAAAAGAARAAGVPLLAFTSDSAQAGPGIWVLGITPEEQVERVTAAAAARGAQRFGLLGTDDALGRRALATLQARQATAGLPAPFAALHAPRGDIAQAARELAEKAGPEGLDAVLLVEGGAQARAAATALATALPRPARLLGTALWLQDSTVGQETALVGAWFPGPDPTARQSFEARYAQAFGARPPRLAGVAYDGAALAARTVRDGNGVPPLGSPMQGADGPILLLPEGQTRRGLAILAVTPSGEPELVEPAPVPVGGAGS